MDATPALITAVLDNPMVLLFARVAITLPFWMGGLMKLVRFRDGEAEMAEVGLRPAWFYNCAVLAVELAGSALIIADWYRWLGAGMLGVFTVFSTLLGHPFWKLTGKARATAFDAFLEHVAIAATFILVAVMDVHGHAV